MQDYSTSGKFGEVNIFDICIYSNRFSSLDRIISVGWHKVNSLYHIERPLGFAFGLLIFTVSGNGIVNVCEKEYTASAGTVTVIPNGCAHSYRAAPGEYWEFYWIHYDGVYSNLCAADIVQDNTHLFDFKKQDIELTFKRYLSMASSGIEREIESSEWLGELFTLILKNSVSMRYSLDEKGQVNEIIKDMESSNAVDFSIKSLSSKHHYSEEYMIRLFKRATGKTPYQYWLSVKLKSSCRELKESDKSIEEIAKSHGYKCVSSYSNQFKKHYKITPQEYRKLYKFN